ncbi:hypothetical protein R3I93_015424 [Phoxinus phoxinus]|uniref:Uncharacterized protein n=1 Tax=Phoxinus phoxinus TaxID=58324 RepID=A0AAN9CMX7_9TELE
MMKLMIQNGAAILHQFVSCKRPGKMSSYQAEQHLVVSKKGPAYKTTLTALTRPYLLAAGDADMAINSNTTSWSLMGQRGTAFTDATTVDK